MTGHAIVEQAERTGLGAAPSEPAPPGPQPLPFPIAFLGPAHVEHEQARARGYRGVRRMLNAMYPGRGRMLEVGSGLGFLLAGFKADGWRAHGIDPDARQCRYAVERHGVATHAVDLERAAIPDAAFDLVVHGGRSGLDPSAATLAEINRILRAGGHCVIDVRRPGGFAEARDIRRRFAEAGFRIIRSRDLSAWPHEIIARMVRGTRLAGIGRTRPRPARHQAAGQRICLQKIAAVRLAAAPRAVPAAPPDLRPAWLSKEVAGVVTIETGHPAYGDVRRGHPWRMPDRQDGVPSIVS